MTKRCSYCWKDTDAAVKVPQMRRSNRWGFCWMCPACAERNNVAGRRRQAGWPS